MLVAQGQASPAGAVFIAVGAVGVEAIDHGVGQPAQLFGPILRALLGQVGFGAVAGVLVDPAGQLVVEAADHRDLAGSQLSGTLCCGGRCQYWRQRFTGESPPLAQIGGLVDASRCLGAADQGPVGHGVGEFAAQLFCGGLARKVIDQRMLHRR